jgi:hypothetical protein
MEPGKNFIGGACFGAGFTFTAILVIAAMKVIFHLGICG